MINKLFCLRTYNFVENIPVRMENTVLVPIDFSEQSLIALKQACHYAKQSGLSVTLLNVIKTSSGFWNVFSEDEKIQFQIKIEKKLRAEINKIKEKYGLDASLILRMGKVIEEIKRVSDYLEPKLTVIGTSSGSSITRKIIGSRALHTIKTSNFPVISIKGKVHSDTCENILLPIDGTKETLQKVDVAIEMAKAYNAKISLVSAIPTKKKKLKELVKTKLNDIEARLKEENIACTKEIIDTHDDKDKMAFEIIAYAHKMQADLIIIMTQREGGISDFFLGSLAQNIIYSSDIPVLTTKPKDIN